ncbi:hypothetical protein DACRYDRAFT_44125, partial [Dacryopinax primogenitus]
DTCILPLSPSLVDRLKPHLQNVEPIANIITEGDELAAWKSLLVIFVERGRAWKHQASCDPICTCGNGLALGSFSKSLWKDLAPHVTRAAISPLFAVSW